MKIPEMAWTTDKLVVVECLLYLFYHSQCLYLLFTYPYPWSIISSLLLWLNLWMFCARAPSSVQYEFSLHFFKFKAKSIVSYFTATLLLFVNLMFRGKSLK